MIPAGLALAAALMIVPPPAPPAHTVSEPWQPEVRAVFDEFPDWVSRFGWCVVNHESIHDGYWKAENPVSTASGAFQYLDGTWRAHAARAGVQGWRRASSAPPVAQAYVFAWNVRHGAARAWSGTSCGYGT